MHAFLKLIAAAFSFAALLAPPGARAAAPASAPQVLIAITNSQSMDGTSSGAIMVGSGSLGTNYGSLKASSSPVNYVIPTGFVPPLNAGSGGSAPYTVACSGDLCDNGPSRLNFAKASIKQVLANYGPSINFGLYTYATSNVTAYTTWVYYMSGPFGFTYTTTPSASTVANPCYGILSTSITLTLNCALIAPLYGVAPAALGPYMNVAATSDAPLINDVLYLSGNTNGAFVSYGFVTPPNPYSYYPLSTYNNNLAQYSVGYSFVTSGFFGWSTSPTNAGYVPYAPQVMYSMRGFGFGGAQSATTGKVEVAMGTDPSSSPKFTTALAPSTNDATTKEIKAVAGQSAIGGLLAGAKTYLGSLGTGSCQQYVVLLTDGLPTLDLQGKAWPPLGTNTAAAYNVTASFNADGSFAASNSQAVKDTIASLTVLANAGIKTYVIGLGAGVDASVNPSAAQLLKAMAIAGNTANYFPANDPVTLNTAFQTIFNQIYTESAVAAPVAPISVADGTGLVYALTTIPSPAAGHVKAYAVSATGTPATTASWDAANAPLMTTTLRSANLLSVKADNSVATLSAIASTEPAAFGLAATPCVPNVGTIVSYTVNPAHSYSAGGTTCSYLAGRDAASLLGGFGARNGGKYVGPPASGLLTQRYASYKTYARNLASRTPMLLFSNNDGFVYAVNAASGALRWAWTTRNVLSKLQNYGTFAASGATNGGFAVVDAQDGGGTWGSYLVGSLLGGAEHFSVKLDSAGRPATVVYPAANAVVGNGTSPGDAAVAAGAGPSRQPVLIAYVGGSAYALYVVTVGTTSTFYEVNVATGASTSTTLGFTVSAALYLNPSSNQLWFGGADGSIWNATVISGNAAADLSLVQKIGNSVAPVGGAAVKPLLHVGYAEVNGSPYAYALAAGQLTVFGVKSTGWTPLWAATTSAGYQYTGTAWVATSGMATLTAGSVVSDQPITIGTAGLLVPTFMAGGTCSAGSGYYNFFDLRSGNFPSALPITYNGAAITGPISVGPGAAFTPSVTLTSDGFSLNPGTGGSVKPLPPLLGTGKVSAAPFSWRQR